MDLTESLLARPAVASSPAARELAVVMTCPVHTSTSGYPYLQRSAWTRFRDWVPHVLGAGSTTLAAAQTVVDETRALCAGAEPLANVESAYRVVRQVVLTASVTAPPELWLLRHVLAGLDRVGVSDALLAGDVVQPGAFGDLRENELRIDLRFLLSRGYLVLQGDGLRLTRGDVARRVLDELRAFEAEDESETSAWAAVAAGARDDARPGTLRAAADDVSAVRDPGRWCATPAEIEIGYRLVPLVLGLRVADRADALAGLGVVSADDICPAAPEAGQTAARILGAAGVLDGDGRPTETGRRVLTRGAGPFGIIEAYRPYMVRLHEILRLGRGSVSVRRGANIAASQDANRRTFEKIHDALDRFCADTGFTYDVFVEHAVGRGEATRQRWARSPDAPIRYFGADLEDAAVDAAEAERERGELPPGMRFVRDADIGEPQRIVDALAAAGVATEGAVMVVGNGFHEVRDQTDESMQRVFEGYERAGIVVVFTEEAALPLDALLESAWNTYHAGFRYVHERSGQGLRPSSHTPPSPLEGTLPASWVECAERAGYVHADAYTTRTRTIYPYTPPAGHNPSISVNHFFVPRRIAEQLSYRPWAGSPV